MTDVAVTRERLRVRMAWRMWAALGPGPIWRGTVGAVTGEWALAEHRRWCDLLAAWDRLGEVTRRAQAGGAT